MARVTWWIVAIIALTITTLISNVGARPGGWHEYGFGDGRRPPTRSFQADGGETSDRRPSDQRHPSKAPACKLHFLNGTLAWDGPDVCPNGLPCTEDLPGTAPFTVDGEEVTVTICDIEDHDFRHPRGYPCQLQFLNETVIDSTSCPAGFSCNISLGIIPHQESGEAVQAFVCDDDDDGQRRKHKCGECQVEFEDGRVEYPRQCRGGPEECTVGPRIETRDGVEARVYKCQHHHSHHHRESTQEDSDSEEEYDFLLPLPQGNGGSQQPNQIDRFVPYFDVPQDSDQQNTDSALQNWDQQRRDYARQYRNQQRGNNAHQERDQQRRDGAPQDGEQQRGNGARQERDQERTDSTSQDKGQWRRADAHQDRDQQRRSGGQDRDQQRRDGAPQDRAQQRRYDTPQNRDQQRIDDTLQHKDQQRRDDAHQDRDHWRREGNDQITNNEERERDYGNRRPYWQRQGRQEGGRHRSGRSRGF